MCQLVHVSHELDFHDMWRPVLVTSDVAVWPANLHENQQAVVISCLMIHWNNNVNSMCVVECYSNLWWSTFIHLNRRQLLVQFFCKFSVLPNVSNTQWWCTCMCKNMEWFRAYRAREHVITTLDGRHRSHVTRPAVRHPVTPVAAWRYKESTHIKLIYGIYVQNVVWKIAFLEPHWKRCLGYSHINKKENVWMYHQQYICNEHKHVLQHR